MEKSEIRFGLYISLDQAGVSTWYEREKMPVEIVMVQLRALLNHLENPYFDDFSSNVSSLEPKN